VLVVVAAACCEAVVGGDAIKLLDLGTVVLRGTDAPVDTVVEAVDTAVE